MTEYCLTVEEAFEGYRLDKYLSEAIPELSRSYLQKVVKENGVWVSGKAVKGSYKITEGEQVKL